MLDSHLTDTLHLLKKQPQHRCKAEIDLLVQMTQELPFFKQYQKQDNGLLIHRECCKYMFIEKFQQSEVVFHLDTIGTKFYVILDGQVEVLIRRRGFDELESVRILKKGESFGELALIHKQPRLATIRCVTDCIFAILDKQQFQKILHYEQTKKIEQNIDFFSQISIFNQLNRTQLTSIYLNSFLYEYEKNQVVVQEGEKSDSFLIVKQGLFQVRKQKNKSQPLILFEIGEMQVFGFYHLYNKIPYEYSIICLSSKGLIYKIHRNSLIEKIFESYSQDLDKYKNEINFYANYKVSQEQSTHLKYPRFFQNKTEVDEEWEIQQNQVSFKFSKNQKFNNFNNKTRNQMIQQKMDNLVEQQRRKQNNQQITPQTNGLFQIFLKSHRGLKDSTLNLRQKSPSVLECQNRQFGSNSHFVNSDEISINPFITYRCGSPPLKDDCIRHSILKTSSSQRTIFKQPKQSSNKFRIQQHNILKNSFICYNQIQLSPKITKLNVYSN
ncbi:unnamed protein product [Paramecium primaurelia]|uniref:Cyclic nucleotide-binding domain-containing protein n=1 Tax=Paramecium primaurelia TaxID=5886 RepID=A0A8S1ME37_PARPR|nr:unnamed protein product [Paramecium primaurelia]